MKWKKAIAKSVASVVPEYESKCELFTYIMNPVLCLPSVFGDQWKRQKRGSMYRTVH